MKCPHCGTENNGADIYAGFFCDECGFWIELEDAA